MAPFHVSLALQSPPHTPTSCIMNGVSAEHLSVYRVLSGPLNATFSTMGRDFTGLDLMLSLRLINNVEGQRCVEPCTLGKCQHSHSPATPLPFTLDIFFKDNMNKTVPLLIAL